MKRIWSLLFLNCLLFIPLFSQAVRHDIKSYGTSLAVVDARPFPVISEAFSSSLDRIIREKVFLVSESSGKGMNFSHKMDRNPDGQYFYTRKSRHIGTVKIMPRRILLHGPGTASPVMPVLNP